MIKNRFDRMHLDFMRTSFKVMSLGYNLASDMFKPHSSDISEKLSERSGLFKKASRDPNE